MFEVNVVKNHISSFLRRLINLKNNPKRSFKKRTNKKNKF